MTGGWPDYPPMWPAFDDLRFDPSDNGREHPDTVRHGFLAEPGFVFVTAIRDVEEEVEILAFVD